jgi:hypothetical protein
VNVRRQIGRRKLLVSEGRGLGGGDLGGGGLRELPGHKKLARRTEHKVERRQAIGDKLAAVPFGRPAPGRLRLVALNLAPSI